MMNAKEIIETLTYLSFLLIAYAFSKTHIMNNLILIEFMIVTIMIILFTMMASMSLENYIILYFAVTVICESMIGLSLMISMIRTHGNDYLQATNVMKY